MQFREADQRLRRPARFPASLLPLLPLLQRALRHPEQSGELRLCQAGLQACSNDRRTRLDRDPLAAPGLDFAHAVQDLLPDVAARLESSERTCRDLLAHSRTPPPG